MSKQVNTPAEFTMALEAIAFTFIELQIVKLGTVAVNENEFHMLGRIRGAIMDHAFNFRLTKVREGEFGISRDVCRVQLASTNYPMESDLIKATLKYFDNEGH